jgi:polyisoprenoid-binding protein YceI
MKSRLAAVNLGSLVVLLTAAAPCATAQDAAPASLAAHGAEATWVVDMVHSQVAFAVRHMVGQVRGTFERYYAVLTTPADEWRRGTVKVTVQTASLNTGNSYRDDDLRSDRFFAVERYPTMTFDGTSLAVRDSALTVTGMLTIKGHSKPVTLRGQYRGIAKDAEGHQRIAFEATGAVNRRDFDINWNETVAGTQMIGDTVQVTITLEAVRAN